MRSILKEFASGNISPDTQFFTQNSEYGKVMAVVSNTEQMLFERLGGEDKELLQKHIDAQGEINKLTAINNLVYGYKLGLIMTAEAFIRSDELITSEEDC